MQLDLAMKPTVISHSVHLFQTNQGAMIYQLPLEAFPGFWTYAYLVQVEDYLVMIDVGSGFGICHTHLTSRIQEASDLSPIDLDLKRLTHIFITHGHIDHFGGLSFVCGLSQAKVGVHELDLRNLTNTEENLAFVSRHLDSYLAEAGLSDNQRVELIQLYRMTKLDYSPVAVDFTFEAVGMQVGPFLIYHVPGHCAGQVVIKLHDVLFSGDHILADISPHQSPERLVLSTGLSHYLQSLDKLKNVSEEIRLTLAGHNEPIWDLQTRIDEIKCIHYSRLEHVMKFLKEPHTLLEITNHLFPGVHGYNELLGLEETGAHVEYLYQHGLLAINNSEATFNSDKILPISYCIL